MIRRFFLILTAAWLLPFSAGPASAAEEIKDPSSTGTVLLRVVVVNPSATKTQTKAVKVHLPQEITAPKQVIDAGQLTLDYDKEQSLYFVSRDVELAANETKTFEVVMEDVWYVKQVVLDQLKLHTERMMEKISGTEFIDEAEPLAKRIQERIEVIRVTQADTSTSKDQRVSQYRDNQNVLKDIRQDIEQLEKILTVLTKQSDITKLNELIKMKANEAQAKQRVNQKTWMVIILLLLFVGILGATFYFTWQKQAKIQENIFSRERDSFFGDQQESGPKDSKKE